MKRKMIAWILILALCLGTFSGCGKQEEGGRGNTLPAAESTTMETTVPAADGFDVLGGSWTVSAVFDRERQRTYALSENEALQDLYDTVYLFFNEDGTFLYIDLFFTEGTYERKSDDSFLLRTSRVYSYAEENGELVEKESTSGKSNYLLTVQSEGTVLRLGVMDPLTGQEKVDRQTLLFELESRDENAQKKPAAAPAESPAAAPADTDAVYSMLRGTYGYYGSNGFFEELTFENGIVTYVSWLESVPEKASGSQATYTVEDDQVVIYFATTDYTNRMDYRIEDGEVILSSYIDSGADKGNTREYVKRDTPRAPAGAKIKTSGTAQKKPATTETRPSGKTQTTVKATTGMKNALKSAKNYLSVMPFSYNGLIKQLEFEGYSKSEATYAADSCGADWYEQAVKSAKNYLDVMSFSRSGLVDQLEYEGYTTEQAEHGVEKAYGKTTSKDQGGSATSGMKNALSSAKNYLSVMAFSYKGLIRQLEYEGYSTSEATYAADNCGADWYEQAVKSAKNYLDVMSFSRSDLIDQLEYEGFTHEQAVHGVNKAY